MTSQLLDPGAVAPTRTSNPPRFPDQSAGQSMLHLKVLALLLLELCEIGTGEVTVAHRGTANRPRQIKVVLLPKHDNPAPSPLEHRSEEA